MLILDVLGSVRAAEFDPNFIITDEEITNYESLTLSEISDFLRDKDGYLNYYYPEDYDGITRTVPEIIMLASIRYQINPKYTLVLLQKEQSLTENKSPSQRDLDWAAGYGVCDSCSTTDPEIQKYKGFGKQVDNGVGFMRFFLDNPEKSEPFTVGKTVTVTDYQNGNTKTYNITPVNQSTANLFKYTPHYQGNFSFWNIWQKYFSQDYPDGTLVKLLGDNDVWLIQKSKKRKFKSFGVLASRYNPQKIIGISKADLDKFNEGLPINFPQYSYLRSPTGTVFLLIDDTRHGFASPEALRIIGINPEEIIDVTWDELNPYHEGKPIDVNSAYPTGALLQNNKTGGVYYVENGQKAPIWSKQIMEIVFDNKKIISVSPEELDKYETLSPVRFNDGELIKSSADNAVYVISDGNRRPISSADIFIELGYNWDNIITTDDKILNLHSLGAPIK